MQTVLDQISLSSRCPSCACFRVVVVSFPRSSGRLRLRLAGIYGTGVKMGRDQVLRILQSSATIPSSNGSIYCSLLTVVRLLDFQGSEGDDHFELCFDPLERQHSPRTTDSD